MTQNKKKHRQKSQMKTKTSKNLGKREIVSHFARFQNKAPTTHTHTHTHMHELYLRFKRAVTTRQEGLNPNKFVKTINKIHAGQSKNKKERKKSTKK